MRTQVAILGVTVWLALLAACDGSGGRGGGQLAGQQIGPAGGEVAVNSGPLTGAKVVVPPNAVNAPVTITIEAGTAVAVGAGNVTVGPAVRLGPSGTAFLVPVTVTLPFSAAQVGGEPVQVAHRNDGTGAVTNVRDPVVNHQSGRVTVAISSFSTLQPFFTPPVNPPLFDEIVFANRPSFGDAEIWVRDAALSWTRITTNDFEDLDPVWSPNHDEIAFVSNRADAGRTDFALVVMKRDGTFPTVESDLAPGLSAKQPAWSPSGRRIAVSVGETGFAEASIWVIDLDQVGAARYTRVTFGAHFDENPAWHPDGTSLVFDRDGGDLYTVPADGSAPPTLLYSDPNQAPVAPTWSRDGQHVFFQAYELAVNGYRIARIDASGANFTSITSGGTHISDEHPRARSGRVIFVRQLRGEVVSKLYIGDTNPANSATNGGEVSGQPAGQNMDPDW